MSLSARGFMGLGPAAAIALCFTLADACQFSCTAYFNLDSVLQDPLSVRHHASGYPADVALWDRYELSAACFIGSYVSYDMDYQSGRASVLVEVDSVLKGSPLPDTFRVICDGAACCVIDSTILDRQFVSFRGLDDVPQTCLDVGVTMEAYITCLGSFIVGPDIVTLTSGYTTSDPIGCWIETEVSTMAVLVDGVAVRPRAAALRGGSVANRPAGAYYGFDGRMLGNGAVRGGARIAVTRDGVLVPIPDCCQPRLQR